MHFSSAFRKFFYDAIPLIGTESSVSLIRDVINSNDVDEATVDMWLTSLAMIPEPNEQMIEEAQVSERRSTRITDE